VLRLEGNATELSVSYPTLTDEGSIEVLSAVELQARFCGLDQKNSAADWVVQPGRGMQDTRRTTQDPVVIEAADLPELVIIRRNASLDWRFACEIEGRVCHGRKLSGWNHRGVDRRVSVGIKS
jgi:hypothetical protein